MQRTCIYHEEKHLNSQMLRKVSILDHNNDHPNPSKHAFSCYAVPSKSTTLWVGKIAATVEADFVRKLLEFCGVIKEWKPATDTKTGAMKGFGFCTYQHPEGVMVALEVLNGLLLDGQSLSLKCNSVREKLVFCSVHFVVFIS